MTAYVVVAVCAVGCYALRYAPVALFANRPLPHALNRALPFVAPAMMTALVATTLRAEVPALPADDVVARTAALLAAVIATVRTRHPSAAIAAGLPTLWLTTAALAAL